MLTPNVIEGIRVAQPDIDSRLRSADFSRCLCSSEDVLESSTVLLLYDVMPRSVTR